MRKNLSCPQFLLLLLLLFRWKLLIDPTISKATSDPKCLPWKTSSLSIFEATFRCFSVDRLARLVFDGIETVLSFVAKIFMMTWLMNLWFFFCVGSNLCVILLTFLPLGNLMKVDSKIRHLLWIVQYQPISSLLHVACKWNLISKNYWNWDRQVLKRYNKKNLNAEMEN